MDSAAKCGIMLLLFMFRVSNAMEDQAPSGMPESFQKKMFDLDNELREHLVHVRPAARESKNDINSVLDNPNGFVMMTAVQKGHLDVVKIIFSFLGSAPRRLDKQQILSALFKYTNGQNQGYASLLFIAVTEGHESVVQFLLDQGAVLARGLYHLPSKTYRYNVKTEREPTGQWEDASRLDNVFVVEHEADYNLVQLATPLHAALRMNHQQIIALLEACELVAPVPASAAPQVVHLSMPDGLHAAFGSGFMS